MSNNQHLALEIVLNFLISNELITAAEISKDIIKDIFFT